MACHEFKASSCRTRLQTIDLQCSIAFVSLNVIRTVSCVSSGMVFLSVEAVLKTSKEVLYKDCLCQLTCCIFEVNSCECWLVE